MATMLKRLFWLAVLGGAGFALWSAFQRRQAGPPPDAPEWPPLETDGRATAATDASPAAPADAASGSADVEASDSDATAERWVDPTEGACPISHPIKANDNSGIYHVPGGRFYERTGAERCYASADDAEADGYRAAKS